MKTTPSIVSLVLCFFIVSIIASLSVAAAVNTCIDTDGGKITSLRGTVSGLASGKAFSKTDYCSNTKTVVEYYCNANKNYNQRFNCPTGSSCVDGACVAACSPSLEVCDNADNDCDGLVDEDLSEVCSVNVGECRQGTHICTKGVWGACVGGVNPVPEACDGLDNDCDGSTDEGMSQTCGTDAGACTAGTQQCTGGAWGACVGATGPGNEVCDGLDNDCDGAVDDGLSRQCGSSDVGECSFGSEVCRDGAWAACEGSVEPVLELCDNKDSDCDGLTDEDLSEECGVSDVGECSFGTVRCTQGIWDSCQGNVDPVAEVCDGSLDNDCDGLTDEGCQCTNGQTQACGASDEGACILGVESCSGGVWGPCVGEVLPATEICNNIDDDCDAAVDENLAQACGSSNIGECRYGLSACSSGAWGSCSGAVYPATEICDGLDNDCDGTIDEVVPRYCGSSIGACRQGNQSCVNSRWGECIGDVEPVAETCDSQDNDCDSAVDENLSCGLVATCTDTDGGANLLVSGSISGVDIFGHTFLYYDYCPGAGSQVAEFSCIIDEHGNPRESNQVHYCPAGTWCSDNACRSIAANCTPTFEVCDTLDNDCDGTINDGLTCGPGSCVDSDNGVDLGVYGNTIGTGGTFIDNCLNTMQVFESICTLLAGETRSTTVLRTCPAGTNCSNGICINALPQCTPTPEVCDGQDNDCDLLKDENLNNYSSCGTGGCLRSVYTCQNGVPKTCTPGLPTAEACNIIDDDCDGDIDEQLNCSGTGASGTSCYDTDGYNLRTKGHAYGVSLSGAFDSWDECQSGGTYVGERVCGTDSLGRKGMSNLLTKCPTGTTCTDGACK